MEEIMNFMKLNSKIFRNTQIILDKALEKYGLSSGSFKYLFILEDNEGISQNQISKEIGNDKAMSARIIAKLIEMGYIYKEEDTLDHRAYNLYLTPAAKKLIPVLKDEIKKMENLITKDLSEEVLLITMDSLKKIYNNTQKVTGREVI